MLPIGFCLRASGCWRADPGLGDSSLHDSPKTGFSQLAAQEEACSALKGCSAPLTVLPSQIRKRGDEQSGGAGPWFHVRTSDDEQSHALPSITSVYSSWSNPEVTVLHASAGRLLNLPLRDMTIPSLAWLTNPDHRLAVIGAAVKALLKESGEAGAWDPGVQFHWQQGRREKRRKGRWERRQSYSHRWCWVAKTQSFMWCLEAPFLDISIQVREVRGWPQRSQTWEDRCTNQNSRKRLEQSWFYCVSLPQHSSMVRHQKISICLHSKWTAVSWPIKLWRFAGPCQWLFSCLYRTKSGTADMMWLTYPINPYFVNQVVSFLWPLRLLCPLLH